MPSKITTLLESLRKNQAPTKHAWGESFSILVAPTFHVDIFFGYKGGRSSIHKHTGKNNSFYLLSGSILLEHGGRQFRRKCFMGFTDSVIIPGEPFSVAAESIHQMTFREDSSGIEIYRTSGDPIDVNDITRFGGERTPDESCEKQEGDFSHASKEVNEKSSSGKLVSADVVADRIGVKPSTIRGWARSGKIPSEKINSRLRRFDLEKVLAAIGIED